MYFFNIYINIFTRFCALVVSDALSVTYKEKCVLFHIYPQLPTTATPSPPQHSRPMSFLVQPWVQHFPATPREKFLLFLSGLWTARRSSRGEELRGGEAS